MKIKTSLLFVGLCGGSALALGQDTRAPSSPARSVSPADQTAPANAASAPALTRAEALLLMTAAKKYEAHPVKKPEEVVAKPKVLTPDFDMATPPPSPRTEIKPTSPAPGMVWVAGHYMPVKGEWRWVRGEWAVPALPISVWIPAKYDATTKHWDPGYWQPDAPSSEPPADATLRDGKAAAKADKGY
ncbi:MAG: YXWGXW repeat-containing protein [Opitutaceae bacterium]